MKSINNCFPQFTVNPEKTDGVERWATIGDPFELVKRGGCYREGTTTAECPQSDAEYVRRPSCDGNRAQNKVNEEVLACIWKLCAGLMESIDWRGFRFASKELIVYLDYYMTMLGALKYNGSSSCLRLRIGFWPNANVLEFF